MLFEKWMVCFPCKRSIGCQCEKCDRIVMFGEARPAWLWGLVAGMAILGALVLLGRSNSSSASSLWGSRKLDSIRKSPLEALQCPALSGTVISNMSGGGWRQHAAQCWERFACACKWRMLARHTWFVWKHTLMVVTLATLHGVRSFCCARVAFGCVHVVPDHTSNVYLYLQPCASCTLS